MEKRKLKFIFKILFIFIILLLYSYISTLNVSAKEIGSYSGNGVYEAISSSGTGQRIIGFNNGTFANWGPGYLRFDYSISTRTQTNSTSAFLYSRGATVTSGNVEYVCDVGTTSVNNSTWVAITYSATCPMVMASTGIQHVYIKFGTLGTNSTGESQYWLNVQGLWSFEQSDSVVVNVPDTTTNDNRNTQAIVGSVEDVETAVNGVKDSVDDLNDTLNNDNVNSNTGKNFFDNFSANNHGLSGIITAPLRLINSLSSSTCSPLQIPLPFVDNDVNLPCMSSIYSTYFPTFLTLYRLITNGLIGYWVLIKIFGHIKGLQNPEDDRIEVFDL